MDQSHNALKEHVIGGGGGAGGGYTLTFVVLSHVPWICYILYQSTVNKGKNKSLLPGGGKYAYD